jgi:DNA-binding CsgD family transcriptional regulator
VIVGREDELARIERIRSAGGVLVVRGAAGVGKTALIGAVDAVDGGVLATAGVECEVELAFGGLHRLLMPLADRFGELTDAQSHALRCALGVAAGDATDLLVCTAVLDLLRAAAPVTVVVDDAHLVDRASTQALLFAARRLAGERVGMILTVREPDRRALDTADLPELRLTGLRPTAVARLLGLDVTTATALTAITGGNPLVLKEIAGDRGLLRQVLVTGRAPVGALFTARLSILPPDVRLALAAAAAEETGDLATVHAACVALGVPYPAELPDLVTIVGGELRFDHPLARSAAYAVPADQRRLVHEAISGSLPDGPRARRHRALASVGPDEALAGDLEADATRASRRGGLAAAVPALLESARLSGDDGRRHHRLASAAYAAWKSGQLEIARDLLPDGASGRLRGLIELYGGDQVTAYELLARESSPDMLTMGIDAAIHAGLVDGATVLAGRIGEIPGYERYGRWLAGVVDDIAPDATPWQIHDAAPPEVRDSGAHRWLLPMAMSLRGRHLEQAREFGLTACADLHRRGTLAIYPIMLAWLAEVELRIGLWDEGQAHAEEGLRAAHDSGHRARAADLDALLALVAATRGDERACRQHTERTLRCPARNRLATATATWATGLSHLAGGDHDRAAECLTDLPQEQVRRAAIADTVEALVRQGDLEKATRLTTAFGQWLPDDAAPWLRALLHRCRALLWEQDKDFQLALDAGLPFDRARTALLYGRRLRRERRIKEARSTLRLAADLFGELGATPWAEHAGAELRACGGVTAPSGVLTHREREIARLAAAGMSNREIGSHLYLSHRTVGYHLHKIFPKLGIANRAQLRGADLTTG